MNSGDKRGRWWLAALAAALAYLAVDSAWRLESLRRINETSLGNAPNPPAADAASPTGYELGQRRHILPVNGLDGLHWIMQTQNMLAGEGLRIRHVLYDNAPDGRDVHWSSLLRWWLAAVAWCDSAYGGSSWPASVERVAPYANTLILAIVLLVLTPVVARRLGSAAAAWLVLGMVLIFPCYDFYMIGSADHHGLAATCCLATVLFLVGGGGGWVRVPDGDGVSLPEPDKAWLHWLPDQAQARRWFLASAVAGGMGLWISAATQVPVLLGTGVGALLAAGWRSGVKGPWRWQPTLWRRWGQVGAAASLFFYLLEYFPAHMDLRLEVNHPLYALAWLGAGGILCRVSRWQQGGKVVSSPFDLGWLLAEFLVLAALPAIIVWMPERTFWVSDAFLWRLHVDYIFEFQDVIKFVENMIRRGADGEIRWPRLFLQVSFLLPVLGLAMMGGLRQPRLAWPGKALMLLALSPCLVMTALACQQIRWNGVNCGMWLVALVTVVLVRSLSLPAWPWGPGRRGLAGLFLMGVYLPGVFSTFQQWQQVAAKPLLRVDIWQAVSRDTGQWLRQRLGNDAAVVLAAPTSSSALIYFGNVRGLGTLYWENLPGLKATAALYAAPSAAEAHELMRQHGVTHIAIFQWDFFGEQYVRLQKGLRSDQPLRDEEPFLLRLAKTHDAPAWLRPLYLPKPQIAAVKDQFLMVYEWTPHQSEAEAATRWAQCWMWAGRHAEADERLQKVRERQPNYLPALVRQAQTKHHLHEFDAFKDLLRIIGNQTAPATDLALEDRIALVEALALADDAPEVRRQLEQCWQTADDRSLRRLEPAMLRRFVELSRQHAAAVLRPTLFRFALRLLPVD